jgi:hypothetical protein
LNPNPIGLVQFYDAKRNGSMSDLSESDRNALFQEMTDPKWWLMMGIGLQIAAFRVDWTENHDFTDWRFIPIYRMLIAFAIENLMKGILIAQGVEPIKDGELSPALSSHNLRRYADEVAAASASYVVFDDHEKALLEELQSYSVWAGRYPTPRSAQGFVQIRHSPAQHAAELAIIAKLRNYLFARKGEGLLAEPPTDEATS